MSLHIAHLGKGPDLVLVHGWGFNSAIWHPIIELLSASFTLHLIDLPGHGLSHSVALPSDAEQVASLISQRTPPHAHYLGWSLGGTIVQSLALMYPTRIDKLIFVASTPRFTNDDVWQNGVAWQTFENFATALKQNYVATMQSFLTLQALGNPAARPAIKALVKQFALAAPPEHSALEAGLQILRDANHAAACKTIPHDCLLIHGNNDKLVPLAAALYLQKELPRAQLLSIPNAGHIPFITQTTLFCAKVKQFLYA